MKVRCRNCFRILNNNEEYCTRCGEHSEEIAEIMRTGIEPVNEGAEFKVNLLVYLGCGFLLNGVCSILFANMFSRMYPEIEFGEIGSPFPQAATYFATVNALLISSIVLAIILFIINYKNLKKDFVLVERKTLVITGLIGIVVAVGMAFITKYTDLIFIPTYFKDYLLAPNAEVIVENSMSYFKVIVILVLYAYIQEIVFRKWLISAIDENTLLNTKGMIVVQALISVVLEYICFSFFASISHNTLPFILILVGSFILHLLLGISYFTNKRTIATNIMLRIVLIVAMIIII